MTEKLKQDGILIGYARVSTAEQSVAMQIEALMRAGVNENRIYSESASGVKKSRPALQEALAALEQGDTLVVWKLDRIARSLAHLLEIIERLEARGIALRSLTEGIDTMTPVGRLLVHVIGSLAQFERDLIIERSRAGVAAAKERGVRFGADFKLPESQMPHVWKLINEEGRRQVDVAQEYNVTPHTIARRLKKYEAEQAEKAARVRTKKAAKKRAIKKST